MLYSEIIAVCSEIHTKHINTLCGQNVEFLNFTAGYISIIITILYTLDAELKLIIFNKFYFGYKELSRHMYILTLLPRFDCKKKKKELYFVNVY
jgi:hypothetical protein